MPSIFRPLKRNCPICSGARRDCRENTQNHLIHCRHDVGEVPGYKEVGEDKHGFFMWAVDDGSDRSEELELKRRSRQALKQRRLQQEQDRLSQLLSPLERDIQIRTLLAQLGLKVAHRTDLHQRGLTDSQIEAGLFRSVEPWQKLDRDISHRLAGINIIGSGLTTPHSGYLCPIWNPEGQIIGWQLRLDKAEDGGKYRWPTSASKKRPNGPTAHLTNGELPLTCCRPLKGKPQILTIGLIEGVGPKPFITAQLRSQIIIGAAGGNFAASQETLKAYLDTVSTELGTRQLTLYPDAGAISNSHVMRQYRRLKELVRSWGYTLRVAWWNQIYKNEDLDADELLAASRGEEIEEITWSQFEAHAHNPNRIYQEIVNLFQKTKAFIQRRVVGFGKVSQRQGLQPLQKSTSVNGHSPVQPKTPKLIQPMESVMATLADFERVMGELERKAPELHSLLKPLALALKPLFNQQLKPPSRYGFDDAAIPALLPEKPENLTQIIQQLEAILQPDFDFIHQPDRIDFDKSISRPMRRLVREHFAKNAYREAATGLENVLLNWFVPFLRVWNGFPGALRCEFGRLTIFSRSTRHTDVIKSLKFNIYLDGTISAERLGLLLDIAPEEILAIEQWYPVRHNLRIVQITGMGKLGKERSNGLKIRVQALRTELLRRHPDIVFGDWKAQAEEGDGQWFVNLHGSNEFQNRSALAVFGIPYQNIGYLQALYQTLTGCYAELNEELPREGLQRFIDAHVEADIEQAMERLRSLIRQEEQLTFYFVGDYDLSFLGMPVKQIEAFLIAPEAGTAAQITRWKIQEAFKQLTGSGEKITQQKLALEATITQGRLSQIAAEFGGWGVLRKILAALLDGFNSATNNFSSLSEEERWLAQTYLPLVVNETHPEALSEIGIALKAYGVKGFLRILQSSPLPTQVRLLSRIVEVMPEGVRQELREVTMGST